MNFRRLAVIGFASLLATSGLVGAANATSIDVLVGDKDNLGGLCSADIGGPGTCNYTGNPYFATDARDAGELAATNGAQFTDEYDAVGLGVTPDTTISFLMPFAGTLTHGRVIVAIADLQASTFGALTADINGTPISLFHNDGFTADNIYTFYLTPTELAAANLAGEVTLNISRGGSGDYVGFDWVELSNVPEPFTLSLFGAGLAGVVAMRRRNKKAD